MSSTRSLPSQRRGPKRAVQAVLDDTGYLRELEAERTVEALGRVENLRELLSVAEEYEGDQRGSMVGDDEWDDLTGTRRLELFLETVTLVSDVDDLEEAKESGHPHDPAQRKGSGVPHRVPRRAGGRGVSPCPLAG